MTRETGTPRRSVAAAVARAMALMMVGALALAACASGPSPEEAAEWDRFSRVRQSEYDSVGRSAFTPTSVTEYVIGGGNVRPAEGIFAGWFISAVELADPQRPGQTRVYGTFEVHNTIIGGAQDLITIDIGPGVGLGLDMDLAARGAGPSVVFVSRVDNGWVLVDERFAIAPTVDGRLSMPLVPGEVEGAYLSGLIDVADIQALAIAHSLDSGGILDGTGISDGGGGSGTHDDLIDKANDIAGN